jgi:PAS domain S-box-containing protein
MTDSGLERIARAKAAVEGGSSRDYIFRYVLDAFAEFLHFDGGELFVARDGNLIRYEREGTREGRPTDSSVRRAAAERAYEAGETRRVDDEASEDDADVRSVLSVPLGDHGVVQVIAQGPSTFDDRDRHLAAAFGEHVRELLAESASATDHARLPDRVPDLLDLGDDPIVVLDTDGTVRFGNRRTRDVLGAEEGELAGRDWFDAVVPESARDDARTVFERILRGENEGHASHRHPVRTSDGEQRTFEWHDTVLRTDGGEVTGVVRFGRDAAGRVSRDADRYRTLVEQFPGVAVALVDEDLTYVAVGGRPSEAAGVTADELQGRRLPDVLPSSLCRELKPAYEAALDGEERSFEYEAGGRHYQVRIAPVSDDGGDVVGALGTSQDITERKRREQALAASRKHYWTLLQAAPDPVFVADADTAEIVEVNDAAERFRGQSRDELVGLHQRALHPDDEAYERLFETHVEEGGTMRRLPDGSRIYAVTADGEEIPVEISAETIDLTDRSVVYGIFRDVTERVASERALTGLHEAAHELIETETPADVARIAVETVTEDLGLSRAVCYHLDEDAGVFRPVAHASRSGAGGSAVDPSVVEPGENAIWQSALTGERAVFEGADAGRWIHGSGESIREEIVAPLGTHAVLVVGNDAEFTDWEIELIETLEATAVTALDRADREQTLRENERCLQRRTQDLETVESINARIRNVTRAVVDADTRREVERAVCTELVDTDPIAFAWVGRTDPVEDRLDVRTWAGEEGGYLDEIDRSFADEESVDPSVRAARTGDPVVVSKTADRLERAPWRQEALRRGFKSVMGVPLVYQGTRQGVLGIYATTPSAFSEPLQSVLTELGSLAANAMVALERKQALVSNRSTELSFEIRDASCFFLRFARETGCSLYLESIVPDDEAWIVFVDIEGESADRLLDYARRTPRVDDARFVDAGDDTFLRLRFTEPFVASRLAEQGMTVRSIASEPDACRLTVAVPATVTTRQAVEAVSATYPDSDLIAKRQPTDSFESQETCSQSFRERLTDRQREVAAIAYRRGYFELPKRAGSDELADTLDISTSAFHQHVRAAERKLFETVFEEDGLSPGQTISRE